MKSDNRNLIITILLSLAWFFAIQVFYFGPKHKQAQEAAELQRQQQQNVVDNPQAPVIPSQGSGQSPAVPAGQASAPQTPATIAFEPRDQALARSPRIKIETPALSGSINLRGGQIDDLSLKKFRETVDPKSAPIVLFSPAGAENAYYAQFDWHSATLAKSDLPGSDTIWTADKGSLTPGAPVMLTWNNGKGLVFKREITLDDKAMFTIRDRVENTTGEPLKLYASGYVSKQGAPKTASYGVLHEGLVGVLSDQKLEERTFSAMEKENPLPNRNGGVGQTWSDVTGGFIAITDKYWAAALIPDQTQPYSGTMLYFPGSKTYQVDIISKEISIPAQGSTEYTQRLFAGAKEVAVIDGYENTLNIQQFNKMIDWGWFYYFTRPLFKVLDYFYKLVGNFGVSILIVTVLLKLLFFPLANKSYVSMAKMKAVQPEMTAIRERYKDDPAKSQQALMELYKKEKINPLAGCWPILIQIPVFFALYKVLFITIEMRHSPFFGWIKDLAAPDPTNVFNLFGLLPFNPGNIPLIGGFLMIGIWPLIMGVTMWLQMKMNPEPTDPVQKQVFGWMPIIFTFMLGTFASGLVIYWAWNNFLSILQQYYIMRRNGVKVELWSNLASSFRRDKKPSA